MPPPPEKRTPRLVLRFYNVAFLHCLAFEKLFVQPKELTLRKLYGTYWHSLTVHTPVISRIVSPRSVNTEQEDRQFADINAISKTTSSGHPSHIIPNSIIRLQAEKQFKHHREDTIITQQSKISKFAQHLPDMPNTTLGPDVLATEKYQAHLERIADYLVLGEGVWWHVDKETNCIEFHDSCNEPEYRDAGPPLYHFRSSTLKSVQSLIQEKWKECLDTGVQLPLTRLKKYDADGEFLCREEFTLFHDQHELGPAEEPLLPLTTDQPEVEAEEESTEDNSACTSLIYVNSSEYECDPDSDGENDDDGLTKVLADRNTELMMNDQEGGERRHENETEEKREDNLPAPKIQVLQIDINYTLASLT